MIDTIVFIKTRVIMRISLLFKKLSVYCILCSLLISESVKAYDIEKNGIYYNIIDGKAVVTYLEHHIFNPPTNVYSGKLIIPPSITYKKKEIVVVGIGKYAFQTCVNLKSIVIPETVEYIEYAAFDNCRSLSEVSISSNVSSIGDYAFQRCVSLPSLIIPASVNIIGDGAFYGCSNLKSIIFKSCDFKCGKDILTECGSLQTIIIPQLMSHRDFSFEGINANIVYQNFDDVKQTSSTTKLFANLKIVPNTLKFEDAYGTNSIEGGSQSVISFKILNEGKNIGRGCVAKVTMNGSKKGIFYEDVPLPQININEPIQVKIPITTNTSVEDGEVEVKIEVSEPNGFGTDPQYLSIKTRAFEPPLIKVTDYSVTASTGTILKKRLPFDLQLMLQNIKHGRADNIQVNIELPENVLLIDGKKNSTINTLDGGESTSVVYSLIVNNKYDNTEIPIKVHVNESKGLYAEDRIINLSLDQSLASSKLKVEETKKMPQKEITIAHLGSDVDKNIPQASDTQPKTFVVIIANENYQRVESVPFASNDGNSFANYCREALGIPSSNIKVSINATLNDLKYQIDWLKQVMDVYAGEARAIFYYAGHGVPDEHDKSAYLLPVDGYAENTSTGYSLEALYNALGALPARSIMVFLDACFSGTRRDGKMLLSARGVAIKAKKTAPKGNMVVYSATQGDETAYPYQSQQHGMFTYYILKKIQQSKGKLSMGELTDYVTQEVKRQSIVTNGKLQTPTVSLSDSERENWRNLMLK